MGIDLIRDGSNVRFRGMKRHLLQAFFLLTILVGCKMPPQTPPPPPPFFDHTVTFPGETMGLIASWYTGTSNNWRAIVDANPQVKPNRLQVGTVIHIPLELVKQREPLPKKIIKQKSSDPKKATASKSDKPTEAPSAKPVQETTPPPTATSEAVAPTPTVPAPVQKPVEETPVAAAAQPTVAPKTEGSAAANSHDKVKDDLLDEILNPK